MRSSDFTHDCVDNCAKDWSLSEMREQAARPHFGIEIVTVFDAD